MPLAIGTFLQALAPPLHNVWVASLDAWHEFSWYMTNWDCEKTWMISPVVSEKFVGIWLSAGAIQLEQDVAHRPAFVLLTEPMDFFPLINVFCSL